MSAVQDAQRFETLWEAPDGAARILVDTEGRRYAEGIAVLPSGEKVRVRRLVAEPERRKPRAPDYEHVTYAELAAMSPAERSMAWDAIRARASHRPATRAPWEQQELAPKHPPSPAELHEEARRAAARRHDPGATRPPEPATSKHEGTLKSLASRDWAEAEATRRLDEAITADSRIQNEGMYRR